MSVCVLLNLFNELNNKHKMGDSQAFNQIAAMR